MPVLPSYRNQSIDLLCKSIDWFLYEGKTGTYWVTAEILIFASLYRLFCGFKNARKQLCVCVLQKRYSSKCCKICGKVRMPESFFNTVKLATFLKKTQVFFCTFFKIIKDIHFIKHPPATASEYWRLKKSLWSLVKGIIFQTFEVSHLER